MGIYSGLAVLAQLSGRDLPIPPRQSAYGALIAHLQDDTEREFAPMNINWGLLPEPAMPDGKKQDKGQVRAEKLNAARLSFAAWLEVAI